MPEARITPDVAPLNAARTAQRAVPTNGWNFVEIRRGACTFNGSLDRSRKPIHCCARQWQRPLSLTIWCSWASRTLSLARAIAASPGAPSRLINTASRGVPT